MNSIRLSVCALICWLLWGVALATPSGYRFVSVAFHDVVDRPEALDADAITTDRLVAFFDLLRGEGWTAITLDDVARARRGEKSLPDKAILISFDDGYRSLYTRVFPLLLAYRIPIVSALVGEWLDAPLTATVQYAGKPVPRTHFISWGEAREMQASGLVEFASHTYSQHRELLANPQGNVTPALATAQFDPAASRYETVAEFRQRLREDIVRNHALFERELGRQARAIVWPYGRYSLEAVSVARSEGFEFALTLNDEPADARQPLEIGRYLPTATLTLADLVTDLRFKDRLPAVQRLVRLEVAQIWSADQKAFDQRLGSVIEKLRALGATGVVIDAVTRDPATGVLSAWFPNSTLPMRGDALNRIAWQIRTRAGVKPIIDTQLPELAAQLPPAAVVQFHQALGWQVPLDGLIVSNSVVPAALQPSSAARIDHGPWDIRRARRALDRSQLPASDRLVLDSFSAVEHFRPELRLVTLTTAGAQETLNDLTDLQLYRATATTESVHALAHALHAAGLLGERSSRRRVGVWIEPHSTATVGRIAPDTLRLLVRRIQTAGAAAIGWSPGSLIELSSDEIDHASRAFSGATFPMRF